MIGAGCGSYVRDQGRGPTQATVAVLEAAPGAEPNKFGGTLASDVVTNVRKNVNGQIQIVPTIFGDVGRVTMSLMLKDPGTAGCAQRADGRERRDLYPLPGDVHPHRRPEHARRGRAVSVRLGGHVHGHARGAR